MIGKIAAYSLVGQSIQHAGIITFFNQKTDEVTIRDFDGNIWNGWGFQIKLIQPEETETEPSIAS
ncbi:MULTISPECIES: hypothetical protein [unclassified Motilimonas]|uniref:hypothetical protein n=1 Tax=Motilimonas TaxID=1914248 RepID=UPI001E5FAB9E|nr:MULTISPECIES: hypothetical protein [unclassified Motilimonas]MCE0557112.1 hypothetical protein [Motilimonas sp. E26]MDO6524347.1 hypothetical protein [Motilimonas sp. 1_MG-2023]